MNYELALKLKEAGFPQENGSKYLIPKDTDYNDGYDDICKVETEFTVVVTDDNQSKIEGDNLLIGDYSNDNYQEYPISGLLRIPTLEELIDAIDTPYLHLGRDNGVYTASYVINLSQEKGQTAVEAMAKLWLARCTKK